MKRKQNPPPNISSSSLRSASRNNKKRISAINSGFLTKNQNNNTLYPSQNKNCHQSTATHQSQIITNSHQSKNLKTIGSSSLKTFTCLGCSNSFQIYPDENSFLKLHVESNEICPTHYPRCLGCNKLFYHHKNLVSHQSRKKKSSQCYKLFIQSQIKNQFMSSQVAIPQVFAPIDNSTIPSHLTHFSDYVNNSLMYSKMNTNYNQYTSPSVFINQNIQHNRSFNIPSFTGHAIIDANAVNERSKFISALYNNQNNFNTGKPTNDNLSQQRSSKLTNQTDHEQIVDFGSMSSTAFKGIPDINNNSSSSLSSSNDSISITSSNKLSPNDTSFCNDNIYAKDIYDRLIINESDDDEYFMNDTDDNCNKDGNDDYNSNNVPNFSSNNNSYINDQMYIPHQVSVVILSENHFLEMKNIQDKELANTICDQDYKECLELIKILMKHKIPLNQVYNEIVDWHNKRRLTSSTMSITSILDKAEQRVYGKSIGSKMKPINTNLICPSGRHVTVTSFDLDSLIFDLLNDLDLMQLKNLIFKDGDEINPFRVNENHQYYEDIHTSEFYQQSCKNKCIDDEKDVLVPIQLYMDETTLDSYSHLQLHPLVMTLLLFNRNTRNLTMSWRTLGYLPNFDSLFDSKSYSAEAKHNDFHYCLRYLLNGLEKLFTAQQSYKWIFQFDRFPGK